MYKLIAPLLKNPYQQYTEHRAVFNAVTDPHFETGGFEFRMSAILTIIEGFEREIAEDSQVLYLRHIGEMEAREVSAWDRFVAYQSIEYFVTTIGGCLRQIASPSSPWIVDVQLSDQEIAQRLTGEERSYFQRATAILAARTVDRPRGRHDPRPGAVRDSLIITFLHELSGCGLDVTSLCGDSLAAAMSEAMGISERTISRVWEAAPAWLRSDKRSRKRYADVPCAQCGNPKVPTWRMRRNVANPLCDRCSPASAINR